MSVFFSSVYAADRAVTKYDTTGFSQTNGAITRFMAFSPKYLNNFFSSSIGYLIMYIRALSRSASSLYVNSFRILHVKGIGFKLFYSPLKHALYFRLGYNHLVKYRLSMSILVRSLKGYLFLQSCNLINLGSTIYEIRHLRFPDPYRGKGIRYRFQLIKFKLGKQR